MISSEKKEFREVFTIIEYDSDPILIVMRDEYECLFLCLCSELRAMHRWIVAPTNIDILHRLLGFEITINGALRAISRYAYVIEQHGRDYNCKRTPFNSIDSCYLAEENAYADFMEEDCENYLDYLEREMELNNRENDYFTDLVDSKTLNIGNDRQPYYFMGKEQKPCYNDNLLSSERCNLFTLTVSGSIDAFDNFRQAEFAA